MDPATISLITMGVGSAVKVGSDLFDDSGAREAKLLREQAMLKQSALEETMRRSEGAQTQVLSSTKARMAATGFDSGSESFTNYLSGMADQFQMQNKFQAQQGMKSIDLMEQGANILADPTRKYLRAATDFLGGAAGLTRANYGGLS